MVIGQNQARGVAAAVTVGCGGWLLIMTSALLTSAVKKQTCPEATKGG